MATGTALWPATTQYPNTNVYPGQGNQPYIVARISFASATIAREALADRWVDVSDRLRSWSIDRGGGSELDLIDTGSCTVVLDNRDRELDPFNTSSSYSPNVLPRRRLWLESQWDGDTISQFYGWTGAWQPGWDPTGIVDAVVTVTAQDAFSALGGDALPTSNPPRDSYHDVVAFDDPWGHWMLGEEEGTRVVAHTKIIRKKRRKGQKKRRKVKKRWTTIETAAEVGGVSGPGGTYINTPTLGETGVLVGDDDMCVKFTAASSEYASITLDDAAATVSRNLITLEAWVKPTGAYGTDMGIIGGPATGGGDSIWALYINTTGKAVMWTPATGLSIATGTTTLALDTWHYLVGTWDGTNVTIFVNTVQEATTASAGAIPAPTTNQVVQVGRYWKTASARYMNGWIDEPAVYEKEMTQARIDAHYEAGLEMGRNQEVTSTRIDELLAASDVSFAPRRLRTGSRDVQEIFYVGQDPRSEIEEAVVAEGDPSLFFFAKDGAAVFLDRSYRSASPWSSDQATFDDDGSDLPYLGLELDDGEAFIYNDVRVTADGGLLQRVTDTASIAAYQRRVLDLGETLNVDDSDAADEAAALLAKYKDPLPRVTGLSLNGGQDIYHPGVLAAILERELGDRIRVNRHPVGGGSVISNQVFLRSISLSGSSTDFYITAQWSLSTR